jgi:hypothetical protein
VTASVDWVAVDSALELAATPVVVNDIKPFRLAVALPAQTTAPDVTARAEVRAEFALAVEAMEAAVRAAVAACELAPVAEAETIPVVLARVEDLAAVAAELEATTLAVSTAEAT